MANDDDDLEIDAAGGDQLLVTEMRAREYLLRYWPYLAAIVVAGIMGVAFYGWYTSSVQAAQRQLSQEVSKVEGRLDDDILTLAQRRATPGAAADFDAAAAVEAAGDLMTVGKGGSGAGAAEAYLKAAELYRMAGETASRKEALEAALGEGPAVLAYAAETALATLELESGDTDAAIARYQRLSTEGGDFLRRQATLDLAAAHEAMDQWGDAVAVYDRYLSTWPEAEDADDVADRKAKAAGRQG